MEIKKLVGKSVLLEGWQLPSVGSSGGGSSDSMENLPVSLHVGSQSLRAGFSRGEPSKSRQEGGGHNSG